MDTQTPFEIITVPRVPREGLRNMCARISDTSTHNEKLFLALALTTFRGLVDISDTSSGFIPSHYDGPAVSLRESVVITEEACSFLIPPHQDDARIAEPVVVFQKTGDVDDPVHAMNMYLASRDSSFPLDAELWLCENGEPPTYPWFRVRLRQFIPFPTSISANRFHQGGVAYRYVSGGEP